LTKTEFISGTTIPVNGGNFYVKPGRNKFIYIYNQPTWEGKMTIQLYDFNFNLITTINTEFDEWSDVYVIKDRFWVSFYNNDTNQFVNYLVSDTNQPPIIIDDNYSYYTLINDWYY